MRFIYVGDPKRDGDGPDVLTMGELIFVKNGEPVEVFGRIAERLKNNGHFKVAKGRPPKKATPEVEVTSGDEGDAEGQGA